MTRHDLAASGSRRIGWALAGLTGLTAVAGIGCSVLNPALVGTVQGNSVPALENARGTILIAVLNHTDAVAVPRIQITKDNGGLVELLVAVLPFTPSVPLDPTNPTQDNNADHAILVQDCDVAQIELIDLDVAGQTIGANFPPLVEGFNLACGDVVVLSVRQSGQSFFADLATLRP